MSVKSSEVFQEGLILSMTLKRVKTFENIYGLGKFLKVTYEREK